jgi:hypothetical protein
MLWAVNNKLTSLSGIGFWIFCLVFMIKIDFDCIFMTGAVKEYISSQLEITSSSVRAVQQV